MAYRTLLAHLPDEDTADAVIGVSVELAERYGARLTGLHVLPPLEPLGYYAYALPIVVDERFAEERAARAERVRRRFDEAVGAARFVAEWRLLESVGVPLENVVGRTANTADLLIAGLDPERSRRASRAEPTPRILATCARPVLLVPPERLASSIGQRVFVAWDGEQASTRALFGALPLMRHADAVRLQRLNPPTGERHGVLGATDDLANTLARHGVTVEVFTAGAREADVGEELLGLATDRGADTVVAGCYERGAFRETLFGSTTRYLLGHAKVALLMSH